MIMKSMSIPHHAVKHRLQTSNYTVLDINYLCNVMCQNAQLRVTLEIQLRIGQKHWFVKTVDSRFSNGAQAVLISITSLLGLQGKASNFFPIQPIAWAGRRPVTISKLNRDLRRPLKSSYSDQSPGQNHAYRSRKGVGGPLDERLVVKSIALAQICGISLAQFLRYSFNDPSGSNKKADRGLPLRSTIPSETGTTISGSR